jgi:hypothetical protein
MKHLVSLYLSLSRAEQLTIWALPVLTVVAIADLGIPNHQFMADWAQVGATAVAVGALIGLLWQTNREGFRHSIDLINKLYDDFHSPEMRQVRQAAATTLLPLMDNQSKDMPKATYYMAVSKVLNHLQWAAQHVQQGALNAEIVRHRFGQHIRAYWVASRPYITERRRGNAEVWSHLETYYMYLHDFDRNRQGSTYDPVSELADLRRILEIEANPQPIHELKD